MTYYRKVSTAPRDGTKFVGLFATDGKRGKTFIAHFDIEEYASIMTDPPPGSHFSVTELREATIEDDNWLFTTGCEELDYSLGGMIGWRPL